MLRRWLELQISSKFAAFYVLRISEIVATDDVEKAFKNIDAAFMVGSMPRKQGMERKDLLRANVKIFKVQVNNLLFHQQTGGVIKMAYFLQDDPYLGLKWIKNSKNLMALPFNYPLQIPKNLSTFVQTTPRAKKSLAQEVRQKRDNSDCRSKGGG